MRVRVARVVMLLVGLWSPPALAVDPEAYDNAVRLIEKLYLHPERVTPHELLAAAGRGLMDEIDWLTVETSGTDVTVRHGSGAAIGSVSVGSWEGLPDALRELEAVVVESGYPVGETDVRLHILLGLTDALDRYSRILHGEGKERFGVRLAGEYEGVGATLGLRDGRLVISDVLPESPAEQAGLEVNDVVVRIDGRSTVAMPVTEATRLVRGEVGTQVVVSVRRQGVDVDVAMTRAVVTEPNVQQKVLPGGVGYIAISHISQRTVENLQARLARLRAEGALDQGLVIDLRGNTGGSMKEAARSADMFLSEGLLLRTEGPDGGRVQNLQAEMRAEASEDEPQIPIVVVVDDRTASGSEILAGALVELERAAIVGTRTYGKGTVQKIYGLDPEVQLKLTVAQYVLANGRLIADVGLEPDVAVGQIELDKYGVRYRGYEPDGAAVPHVVEHDREGAKRTDVPLEIARRAVLRAEGTTRASVLAAARAAAAEVRAEQETVLTEALAVRNVDWTLSAGNGALGAAALDAEVEVSARPDPDRADVYAIQVQVDNREDRPLDRVLVELDCPSFYAWDHVVVPIGRVEAGATGTGEIAVPLPPGIDPREDLVTVRLRAHDRPALLVGDEVLAVKSSALPSVAVSARMVPHRGDLHRVEVTVQNLSASPIAGVEAAFEYPFGLDVELMDGNARIPVLPARGSERLDLTLRLGASAPKTLPLDLIVETERYRTLLEWPLQLPTDGTEVALQAPLVRARASSLVSAPVGRFGLPLVVSDETKLDHVVVFANGTKIAWAPGGRSQLELRPELELFQGPNQVLVIAEDEHGVRTRKWFVIRGEVTATVDAAD